MIASGGLSWWRTSGRQVMVWLGGKMWRLILLVIPAQAIAFGIAWATRQHPRVLVLGDYLAAERDSKVVRFVVRQEQDADAIYEIPIREFQVFLKGR